MADKEKSGMMRYMKYSIIGFELAGSIIVGGGIGYWLDLKLGTDPWMFIFWLICGFIAGFRSLYRMTKNIMEEMEEDENQGPS